MIDFISKSVALAPPAVRMILIRVSTNEVNGHIEVHEERFPVVTIRSILVDRYSKKLPLGSGELVPGNHDEAIRDGWKFSGTETLDVPLVWDHECGLSDEESMDSSNAVVRVVCCPWEPSEDNERLSTVITELFSRVSELHYM